MMLIKIHWSKSIFIHFLNFTTTQHFSVSKKWQRDVVEKAGAPDCRHFI